MKKHYLVTGGTGSLGEKLVEKLIEKNHKVSVLSRNESKLVELKQKIPDVGIYCGDISDELTIKQAMMNIDGVFHLAASKHVELSEQFVKETIETNVLGSINIYNEALKKNIDFVVSVSTDKAEQPTGVYSSTKMLMEKISNQYNNLNSNCKYKTIRFCNLLYSSGSVFCKWKTSIINNKPLYITDPDCTRFIQTIDEAVEDTYNLSTTNSRIDRRYRSICLGLLLTAMIEKYGNGKNYEVVKIGLRSGERLHEKIQGIFSNESSQLSLEEIKNII